jgi:hypothetical protein
MIPEVHFDLVNLTPGRYQRPRLPRLETAIYLLGMVRDAD